MNNGEIKLDCDLNSDDIIALSNYYWHNPRLSNNVYKWFIRFILLCSLIAIFCGVALLIMGNDPAVPGDDTVGFGIFATIFGLLGVSFFFFLSKWRLILARRNINNGKGILPGMHSYSISSAGITDLTKPANRTVQWAAVQKIVQTEQHVFILFPFLSAFIIPRRAFATKELFQQFVGEVQSFYRQGKT